MFKKTDMFCNGFKKELYFVIIVFCYFSASPNTYSPTLYNGQHDRTISPC